jgi:S-DNA-T family DNA segregation ATPase FtsK/SpoIIIE
VLGLILIAIAVLLCVAIASYSEADRMLVDDVTMGQAFDPAVPEADNLLGVLGAHLAFYTVPQFLGYPVLGFALLLFVWGYVAFRRRTTGRLPFVSVLVTVGLFVLSAAIGWIGQVFSVEVGSWSGLVGQGLSLGLARAFGAVGSGILLALLLAVLLLVGIDREIQHTLDRI